MSGLCRNTIRLSFFPFIKELISKDKVDSKNTEIALNTTELAPETGWDRLEKMFTIK